MHLCAAQLDRCAATGRSIDSACLHAQSYIDFEIGEGERERTRELYERLLQRTHHVKVWMSYADFEAAPMPEPEEEEEEAAEAAAASRAQAAQRGPESAASREARARRCEERVCCKGHTNYGALDVFLFLHLLSGLCRIVCSGDVCCPVVSAVL